MAMLKWSIAVATILAIVIGAMMLYDAAQEREAKELCENRQVMAGYGQIQAEKHCSDLDKLLREYGHR
jgi:hypothetical protein